MTKEELYAKFKKHAVGAEVGVYEGDNAEDLIRVTQPAQLFLVDRFDMHVENYEHDPLGYEHPIQAKHRFFRVDARFDKDIVTIIRARSRPAPPLRCQLDWVYIDANHLELYEDLHAWVPLVKAGGWVSRDDNTILNKHGHTNLKLPYD